MATRDLNKLVLVGKVGLDPAYHLPPEGGGYATVSLSTARPNDGGVDWHRLVFRDKLAGTVAESVKKGVRIYVEGRLDTGGVAPVVEATDLVILSKPNT